MKLVSVLATTVLSSHYRGGTYIFSSNADGTTTIQQTQTYRDGLAGTPSKCTKAYEGKVAHGLSPWVKTTCRLISNPNTLCPDHTMNWPYTVGFASNGEMGGSNDYCYGSYDKQMRTPSAGYRIGWSGAAWVDLTADDGGRRVFNQGKMEVYATINDPTNNSPVFTHPPLWRIMSGCDGQKIDLSPVDPDGDRIKCRWAEVRNGVWEAGAATYNADAWPSLRLDGDNCIVHYTGSMDKTYSGLKGVGIMMEDFDSNGNVKSSIPVQFLAAVWTPQTVSRGVALPFVYPDWFAETDGDHHHDHMDGDDHKPSKKGNKKGKNRGRRTTTPSYCNAVPEAIAPTPPDGDVIEPSADGSFKITLRARSSGGYIKSYSFEKPALMFCTNPDDTGTCTCTWTPTDLDRQTRDHGFCFLATDSLGLTTERRCITLRVPLKPACSSGYENSANGSCQDIDECARNTDNCHQNAECKNLPGSFSCTCNSGYRGDGVTCADENECSTGNHNCHYAAKCSNTPGSFTCACNSGYRGDGVACTEIDECREGTDNCHSIHGTCTNTPGSFTCACNNGFRGNGVNCNDINECAAGTDNCHANAKCSNTIGSFTCACNNGYEGDGVTCNDIDECARETDNCHEFAKCTNIPGSFTCACLAGYRGDGVRCVDIDECAEGSHVCDINAECDNTQGAYECTCNTGFEDSYTGANGFSCVDIDECLTGAHACHAFGTCTNTIGSYDCACNDGYMGDGFECTVPCATFYDTGRDGFLTNTSAFTTGTFDVTNLATFDTSPSQDGISNWKMDSSFNNKASFVAVKEKCTLEGYSANNFGGKKLGKWQGKFFTISINIISES